MLLINGLAKVANDPIVQSAGPDVVIGIGRHEDRRNRIPRINEVSIEFEGERSNRTLKGSLASGMRGLSAADPSGRHTLVLAQSLSL
jgi:hypothetical protein